jgi:hypothetical protein
MHELGHNLGLRHGGDDHNHFEPNYLSIMNYSFQTRGLRNNNQDGHFDYSRFSLPNLDENNLDERIGLNGGAAINGYGTRYYCTNGSDRIVNNANGQIDWNCNGSSANTNVQTDVNKDSARSVLGSYNDWANLVFTGGAIGQPGAVPVLPTQTEVAEITKEQDSQLTTLHNVIVGPSSSASALPGSSVAYTFEISNTGINADTYSVAATSSLGWANLSGVPSAVILAAGASTNISIVVTVPGTAAPPTTDVLSLTATSQTNPLIVDSAVARTGVVYQTYLPLLRKKQ